MAHLNDFRSCFNSFVAFSSIYIFPFFASSTLSRAGLLTRLVQEHHLQAAISAHQAAAVGSKDSKKVFIPTPNTTELSAEHYGKIYPKGFQQPFSYIRSSATVEDCCGTSYCMSTEDDKYLAKLNSARKSTLSPITEDEFETIMDLYESTIQQTQPYLSMDVMNIIPFEELEHAFEENLDSNLRAVAKSVYSYWKEQKISRGGRSIIPCLKVAQHSPTLSFIDYRC